MGGVRVKTSAYDSCFVSAYAPVVPKNEVERAYATAFWQALSDMVSRLPFKCTPYIMLDANGHVGTCFHYPSHSEFVGQCEPERENLNGYRFHQLVCFHDLVAVNPFFLGQTLYGQKGTSRVDYVATIVARANDCTRCAVWRQTWRSLQLMRTAEPRDHVPAV